ncbi:MAG TPA: M20/M25/M40 family metallo-hydrolase, partial [Candidatus Saccharimonadia bacterium]|nr:M20/M25/M40 family metallo-hydrolase [Candidatus Saccharimonadia bacterium]
NKLKQMLEDNPPYGAKVEFEVEKSSMGWAAPSLKSWLRDSVDTASKEYFGPKSAAMGEGGTIPFMGMLQERFPQAQFMVTGLLGPKSNAHGPNEFLHIPTGKKLTASVAKVLRDHYVNRGAPPAA